jgi:hypothetical protein
MSRPLSEVLRQTGGIVSEHQETGSDIATSEAPRLLSDVRAEIEAVGPVQNSTSNGCRQWAYQ